MLLKGKALIEYVLDGLRPLDLPMILIANEPEKYASLGLPIYPDLLAGAGSLGGLYTAIYHSAATYTLCVACDMPFLNPALLRYMLSLATEDKTYDAVVPHVNGFPEPLHAIYGKTCLPAIRRQIDQGTLKIGQLYDDLNVRYVPEAEIKRYDPSLRSFANVNTPEDWQSISDLSPESNSSG